MIKMSDIESDKKMIEKFKKYKDLKDLEEAKKWYEMRMEQLEEKNKLAIPELREPSKDDSLNGLSEMYEQIYMDIFEDPDLEQMKMVKEEVTREDKEKFIKESIKNIGMIERLAKINTTEDEFINEIIKKLNSYLNKNIEL